MLFVPRRAGNDAPILLTLDLRGENANANGTDALTWPDVSGYAHDYSAATNATEPSIITSGGPNGKTFLRGNGSSQWLPNGPLWSDLVDDGSRFLVGMVMRVQRSTNMGDQAVIGASDFQIIGDGHSDSGPGFRRVAGTWNGNTYDNTGNVTLPGNWGIWFFARGRYTNGGLDTDFLLIDGSGASSGYSTSDPVPVGNVASLWRAGSGAPYAQVDVAAIRVWRGGVNPALVSTQTAAWKSFYGL